MYHASSLKQLSAGTTPIASQIDFPDMNFINARAIGRLKAHVGSNKLSQPSSLHHLNLPIRDPACTTPHLGLPCSAGRELDVDDVIRDMCSLHLLEGSVLRCPSPVHYLAQPQGAWIGLIACKVAPRKNTVSQSTWANTGGHNFSRAALSATTSDNVSSYRRSMAHLLKLYGTC